MSARVTIAERWRLVRGADVPAGLRLTLYVLHCFQGGNASVFARRETLADEVGVHVDQLSRKLQALERLSVIRSLWTQRNGRPSREHAIDYGKLQSMQRSSLTESSECETSSLTDSSESTLTFSTVHSDVAHSSTLTNSSDMNIHRTSMNKRERAARTSKRSKPRTSGTTAERFEKPTADDVLTYAVEQGHPSFDAGKFVDHYESNGWRVGRNAMKDWRATVRNWIRNGGTSGKPNSGATDAVWQRVRQAARLHQYEPAKFADMIGPDAAAVLRSLRKSPGQIVTMTEHDAREFGREFVREWNSKGAA